MSGKPKYSKTKTEVDRICIKKNIHRRQDHRDKHKSGERWMKTPYMTPNRKRPKRKNKNSLAFSSWPVSRCVLTTETLSERVLWSSGGDPVPMPWQLSPVPSPWTSNSWAPSELRKWAGR